MPLYLVHRPNRDAWLVSAKNTDQLIAHLDATGGADGCSWDVYDGPICVVMDMSEQLPPELQDRIELWRVSSSSARVTLMWPGDGNEPEDDGLAFEGLAYNGLADDGLAEDIAYVLNLAREDWINSLDIDGLRSQLRHTLQRLDECEALLD